MSLRWFHSLRVQIGLAVLAIFLVLAGTLGYTLYALELRKHDYLILNLTGQLRIISQTMVDQARHYAEQAPDDNEKYDRDLGTYWQDLQKQTALYERIVTSLQTRQLDAGLTGKHETIYCTFDDQSRNQLSQTAAEWKRFKTGLDDKLGKDSKAPRLTWAAEYIDEHGEGLAKSSEQLALAFQHMMEEKLDHIRLFQWAAAALGLLLLVVVLYVVQRLVIRPLDTALEGFSRVARGDFSHPVPVLARNEIGQMAVAFNGLTERLNGMFRLTDRINQGKKLDEMLGFVHEEFQGFVPLDWVGVFQASPDGSRLTLERHFSDYASGLKDGASFDIRQGALAMLSASSEPVAFRLEADRRATLEGCLALDGLKSAVYLPLLGQGETRAVMVFASQAEEYRQEHVEFLSNVAATMSHVLEKTVVMENLVAAAVQGLAKLAESRDPETGDHLTRMALYSALVAEELGRDSPYAAQITPAYVRDVFHFAPMHDIGKVGIPDNVLLKPGRLDSDERKDMERHPSIGGEVLRRCEAQVQALGHSMFQVGIEIAECHHEKFDGSGYPAGVKGQDIPLSARIVAVADVFDALTSKRPYKDAWPVEKALAVMQEEAGTQFDPDVIIAMGRALPRMLEIYDRLKHV
ncbi:MAG: HAMP domain-containing protein [Nitrosomonadales bacterium]|nr:MAG: HAMP domain-containing protein [Nitrosomonadales bacterium]